MSNWTTCKVSTLRKKKKEFVAKNIPHSCEVAIVLWMSWDGCWNLFLQLLVSLLEMWNDLCYALPAKSRTFYVILLVKKTTEQAAHSNIRFRSLEPTHPSSFHSPLWSTAPKSLTDIFSRLWTGEEYKLHNVFRNYVASTYFLLSSTILAITRGLHIVIEGIPYSSISSESPSITIQSNSVLPWQVAPNFIPVYFRL